MTGPAVCWCIVRRARDQVVALGLRESLMKHRSSAPALRTRFVETFLLHPIGELDRPRLFDAARAFVAPQHRHAGEARTA